MKVPFLDLQAQHRALRPELDAALARVLDSGQFVLGDEVAAFERELASYCGAAHAVAVSSGTSALQLALIAAGVGPGDEVVTVPFTFVATVAAVLHVGAHPVLVDVDDRSLTIDVDRIEQAITPRTRAIVPVHLYGQPADMDPIRAIAARHGIAIVEDAAQAHGARYRDRPAGGLGDLACFSFYPSKNLGACGEGGAVVTGDPRLAEAVRSLRDWGQRQKYRHDLRGFNARMDGFQGAVLRVKLRHLPAWTERRRQLARRYDAGLAASGLTLPVEMPYARHVYHLYTVRARARDALQAALASDGVATGLHYPIPVHLQPAYAGLGARGQFPIAERAAGEVLSLPLYPEMSDAQADAVVGAVMRAATAARS
ncbi:MAG: DegT/DnrJ/EryC1/StrS family aminotransferase [Acidobacteria bacterium]|nr:DegT/DnrJ/EryC1/StrS family aminotransferase [Acidobacteriota bacterium]